MTQRVPAEVFPPGEFLKDELEERGWTQADLAEILGRPVLLISQIVTGKRAITPETARGLEDALGADARFWLNLQASYDLTQVERRDPAVAKRAWLYKVAPVREMVRRGWIQSARNVSELEKQLAIFFERDTLDEEPSAFPHAARRGASYLKVTPSQRAWLWRARKLARMVDVRKFTDAGFRDALATLSRLRHAPQEARHVPRVLADAGVRFIVLEHLSGTRIDGTCFWLDHESPVIVLSLRYDRIDWFWFTLAHESDHVKERHGQDEPVIDVDLVGDQAQRTEDKPEEERRADLFGSDFTVPQKELDYFIARVRPLYSKERIVGFANRIGVHPGLVVGQLQKREQISYKHSREMLVRVREHIISSALTDGWGNTVTVM